MAAIWYIGLANVRSISAGEWTAAGITGVAATAWDQSNGWSIPKTSFNAQQIALLDADDEFNVDGADGPRPGSAIVPSIPELASRSWVQEYLTGSAANPASPLGVALNATFVPKWKATTAYLAGDKVLSPSGDVVSAIADFTSGASYNAANWNLSTTFAPALVGGKAAVRKDDLVINVKDYSVVGNGTADDTAALQALINTVRDNVRSTGMVTNNVIGIPGGRYKLTATLVIPTYVKLKSLGTVIFEWYGTGAPALWIAPLASDPSTLYSGLQKQQWQLSDILAGQDGGFVIVNKSALGGGNTGLELGSRSDLGGGRILARYALTNVAIQSFDTGIKMNVYNHFIGTYNNFHIENNTTGLAVGGAGALMNSGENFRFNNSIFAGASTSILYGSPGVDLNLYGCSLDFNDKMISAAYGYGKIAFYGGHIEATNATPNGPGGVVVSTVSSGTLNLHFDGTTFYNASQTLFKGTRLVVTGTIQDRSLTGDVNTVYPNSIRFEDQVRAVGFKNIGRLDRRIMSRNQNLIADPYWTKETAGAIATLNDWTWSSSGATVSMVATTPNSTGNSLKLALAAGAYITLTYKYDITLRDLDAMCQTLAFQTDVVGTNVSFQAILKDASGAATTTGFVQQYQSTTLPANVWNLAPYLTDIPSADVPKAYRSISVRPVILISNPTGSAMNVMIPFIYLGP